YLPVQVPVKGEGVRSQAPEPPTGLHRRRSWPGRGHRLEDGHRRGLETSRDKEAWRRSSCALAFFRRATGGNASRASMSEKPCQSGRLRWRSLPGPIRCWTGLEDDEHRNPSVIPHRWGEVEVGVAT